MNRRSFLAAGPALGLAALPALLAAQSAAKLKITRIRAYLPPNHNPTFNQSDMVVTVETDGGVTGVGEGGTRDMLEQCAGRLIGRDPLRIEYLWQDMARSWFYPPGREKLHALGALDLALWDIRGKTLNQPLHALLGGAVRNYLECYNTSGVIPGITNRMTLKERAQATIAAGYRAFRMGAADAPRGTSTYNTRERLNQLYDDCVQVREGVGKNGDWCVDFHQRFDLDEAIRGCDLIKDLAPFFVEDPVRTEAFAEDLPILRRTVHVPLAAGEEWGYRWDFNPLVETHALDFVRVTLPNVGGITEMRKIAALCETHFIGIVPHFTGPIATAALIHTLAPYPGVVLMEFNNPGRPFAHLPQWLEFRNGKLYPNDRPGIGVELDLKPLTPVMEITQPGPNRPVYHRPDGSITNW